MAASLRKDFHLPPTVAATALRELGESPATRRDSLQELRMRITEADSTATGDDVDGYCIKRLDDEFLLRFLRCKKFNVHRSLKVYEGYTKFRQDNKDLLKDIEPQAVSHIWESGLLGGLKCRDRRGRSVMLSFPGRWIPSEQSLEELLQALVFQLEYLIESHETQVNGIVLIADFTGFSFYQARCIKPWYFQVMAGLIQNAFPARFKGVYIVNQPWYISAVLSLLRPFLSEKMNNRIFLLGSDRDKLHEHFHRSNMPMELSGTLSPYNGSEWAQVIIQAATNQTHTSSLEYRGIDP